MNRKLLALVLLPLAACSHAPATGDSAPAERFDASGVADAVPRSEPRSRYGNPESYVVFGKTYRVLDDSSDFRQKGTASWYGTKFHGRRTSSGEPYDMYQMTAAHKTLPLPTYVRVTNLNNGRSVIVRVNDRGPFHGDRVIDLSYAAALKLDVVATGTAPVEIVALDPDTWTPGEPGEILAASPDRDNSAPAAAIPAEPGPSPDAGSFFLQLGAFSDADNALLLKGRIESAGIRPVLVAADESLGLFRVRIGPVASENLANDIAMRLAAIGISEFHIVDETAATGSVSAVGSR